MRTADLNGMETRDRDSNIIWFAEQCRSNHVPLESLIKSAERAGDRPLADFFRRAYDATGGSQPPAAAA
jgi:hypothetical protein